MSRQPTTLAGLGLWGLLGCATPEAPAPTVPHQQPGPSSSTSASSMSASSTRASSTQTSSATTPGLIPLASPRLLRRISLDLRGVLPTTAELDAVEADPAQLDELRTDFLADARLADRLVALYAERWQTRLDDFQVDHWDYGFDDEDEFRYERSIGEEPLRLMAHVVVEDLPWSTVVTADYTLANEVLAQIWPLERDGSEAWAISHYTDGRPAAGVLATNGLWWRYVTNISNLNRARAAALTQLLLCQDVLSRPVDLGDAVDLNDKEGTANAIRSNSSCQACHAALEPLAATLFGFWTVIEYNAEELGHYHGEREPLGQTALGVTPAFFGEPLQGLIDLGPAISRDPRFLRCAAQSHAELLWRRTTDNQDFDRIEQLRQELIAAEGQIKPLLSAITQTPEYQAGGYTPEAPDTSRELTHRPLTPDQLATTIEDLTGFTWTWEGYVQLINDDIGYRVLLGGVDGYTVSSPQLDPGLTWALTIQRLAEAAADHAVSQELIAGATPRLFGELTVDTTPADPAFEAELSRLHWRLYATRPDAQWLGLATELWQSVSAESDAPEAWRRLISAMLRDPLFVGY